MCADKENDKRDNVRHTHLCNGDVSWIRNAYSRFYIGGVMGLTAQGTYLL